MVWKPTTTAELQQALKDGSLPHESTEYEYKQQLPATNKTYDIAVDVSAMTVNGGIIIYGVGENKAASTFFEHPIDLQGVNDRISNTVVSNIQERPAFDIQLLKLDSDPTQGFVVVDVPASPLSPHMVEVKGEYRFYGRAPGGNVPLTQSEVARLYERRRQIEDQGKEIVESAIAAVPIQAIPLERGDLHLVARPLLPDRGIRLRAYQDDDGSGLAQTVAASHNALKFRFPWSPHLADILQGGNRGATMDGVVLTNYPTAGATGEPLLQYYSRFELQDNGLVRYFRAAVATEHSTQSFPEPRTLYALRDPAIQQLTAQFARVVGVTLQNARYQGLVDVYIAVVGAKSSISAWWIERHGGMFPVPGGIPQLATDDYRDEVRVSVEELLNKPTETARRLTQRLLRTIRMQGAPDALELS